MTTTLSTTSSDSLLRMAMRVDAVLSGLCGVALMAAAGPISGFTGFSKTAEFTTGAVFLVYAVVVFLAARLRHVRTAGIATAIANLVFTVAAVVVVIALDLPAAGVVATLASGVYTLVFADLQYLGVRRIK
ncbi:hypothetical protein ACQ856_13390 [Mycolicibacterium psychrotolerans]|uniref:hypothetical protein n=1 Tax=Mycolicibacterium psychrotolerans TaxID=216929 RepID=UPI003D66A023